MHVARSCDWERLGLGNVGPDLYDFVYNDVPAVFNDVLLIHTGTMCFMMESDGLIEKGNSFVLIPLMLTRD